MPHPEGLFAPALDLDRYLYLLNHSEDHVACSSDSGQLYRPGVALG